MSSVWSAPSGPAWVKDATEEFTVQTDGRGERWMVSAVLQGGREIRWMSLQDGRRATTIATEQHPEYPSDAAVLEAERVKRRAAAERARRYYP